MDPLVFVLTAGVGAASIFEAIGRLRKRGDSWLGVAREAGLTEVELTTTMGFVSGLSGKAGTLGVRMEKYRRGKKEAGTRGSPSPA